MVAEAKRHRSGAIREFPEAAAVRRRPLPFAVPKEDVRDGDDGDDPVKAYCARVVVVVVAVGVAVSVLRTRA